MNIRDTDRRFVASVAEVYQRLMVPLIFEPYAVHIAERVATLRPARVLELACGTGVATRELAKRTTAEIVATDLNQAMLDQAMAAGTSRPVEWRVADAVNLPFDDGSFDVIACQFGVMFFPDKAKAFAEAKRVLRKGGTLVFSVWDRIEDNEFADVVTNALAPLVADGPRSFVARTPHGYYDVDVIATDLARGGFDRKPRIETIAERSRAASASIAAMAYCQGTPLRNELESQLTTATQLATAAIAKRFGDGAVDGKMQAHLVESTAP
jgi:SAM-dependent methyltransferase